MDASRGSFEESAGTQLYAFQFYGVCLGDWIPNGAEMIVDPTLEIRPFDLVGIVLKPDAERWSELMNAAGGGVVGVCKFYMGTYEAAAGRVHIVGQLTPPCVALMPETAIEAMHRVVGSRDIGEMTPADRRALELIRPFANDQSTAPISPTWIDTQELAA